MTIKEGSDDSSTEFDQKLQSTEENLDISQSNLTSETLTIVDELVVSKPESNSGVMSVEEESAASSTENSSDSLDSSSKVGSEGISEFESSLKRNDDDNQRNSDQPSQVSNAITDDFGILLPVL